MAASDLGTYFIRCEFAHGTGFIEEMRTNGRWLPNAHETWGPEAPLSSWWQAPGWKSEEELLSNIRFRFFENTCDCNFRNSVARAHGKDELPDESNPCGSTLVIKCLTVFGPDGEPVASWTEGATANG